MHWVYLENNLVKSPISGSLTWSYLQSSFCHVRYHIHSFWGLVPGYYFADLTWCQLSLDSMTLYCFVLYFLSVWSRHVNFLFRFLFSMLPLVIKVSRVLFLALSSSWVIEIIFPVNPKDLFYISDSDIECSHKSCNDISNIAYTKIKSFLHHQRCTILCSRLISPLYTLCLSQRGVIFDSFIILTFSNQWIHKSHEIISL